MNGFRSCENIYLRLGTWIYLSNLTGYIIVTKRGSQWPHAQPRSSHPRATATCTSRGIHKGTNHHATRSQCHHTLHRPPCGLSRAKFSNIYRGVLQNFPGGSVWTLALQVDGSGLVLQLVRVKLHPKKIEHHVLKLILLLIDGAKVHHVSLFISKLCDENNIIL